MWVLIAHAGGHSAHMDFKAFVAQVKAAFTAVSAPDVKYMVKHGNQLRPWLFEDGTAYGDPVSVTRFDRLDFVFVYGDPSLMPWMKSAQQARVLLRMCYNTGKATFCVGFAAQMLAYVSATGGRDLTVVNGGGRGGELDDITRCPVPDADEEHPLVTSTAVFLDHRTGDAFRYDRTKDVWTPLANVGLQRRDLSATRAHYRPKEATHKCVEQVFTAKRHEETCRVAVSALQHWACERVSREFVVHVWGRWKLALQSIQVRVPSFNVLAEAPWGPLIFEVSNLLGLLFDVNTKNPQACRILRNFVKHKFELMQQCVDRVLLGRVLRYEHIDNSGAMLLPTHPRDSKGNPIVAPLRFGPAAAVRESGQALETPREDGEDEQQGLLASEVPAFNTYHSTRLRMARSAHSRRPTSATVRTVYSPASARRSPRPGARRMRPASARPVLGHSVDKTRVSSTFTGAPRRHGAPVGRPPSTMARRHSDVGATFGGTADGYGGPSPRWSEGDTRDSYAGSRTDGSSVASTLRRTSPRATVAGTAGPVRRTRPASASARVMRPLEHDYTPRAAAAMASTRNRMEYQPRRRGAGGRRTRTRPQSSQPLPSERSGARSRAVTTGALPPRGGSAAAGTVRWVAHRDGGPASQRSYRPRAGHDGHDRPRTPAGAAAVARGAAISPRDQTNPHSPRGHTSDKLAEYAFARGTPRVGQGAEAGAEAGSGGRGGCEPVGGKVAEAGTAGNAPATAPKPPAPKRVVIKYKRRPYSAYRKFKKMADQDAERGSKFASVRADGTPFMSGFDRLQKADRENKKKWLGGQFNATFGKRTAAAVPRVPLITAQTDYYPPLLHKFRDEDKSKFVASRDFIVA